ncbi:hypothetical protein IMAU30049_01317 [Lactobacillus helveticus]|uniref:Uncharacterized protein n=2 Tax=Lactobacillus helveticus TaxID=1587 RepID=A0A3S8SA51_LACHE|nr:hypothetical protein R0052_06470 [Lactobacillus helveticus R0052]AZK90752.1 hypothetical protein LH5_00491 [Lactobacillus helveticus]NRO50690.1 hypothetical protein [Lactobacillus helveticus]NRO64758.1 hypothetical protein [Lactobacillus helveticus]NRO68715.1 hypothetical protein [Lactobacillus helveticus]
MVIRMQDYKLEIDVEKQTIQGITIPNLKMFQQICFVVKNNHLEGWKPEAKDVKRLVEQANKPEQSIIDEINEAF